MIGSRPQSVFDKRHRAATVGIILGVTLFAFEAMAVVTVAPRFTEALGGLSLYGWVFSGFLLASLLGAVMGGQIADRRGPSRSFTLGLVLFGAGLLLAGLAPNMITLIVGRVLQGLGGGGFGTSLYVVINLAYADELRPRMMALTSSAWVLPALIGPAAAGVIAEAFSWRLVFWGLLPLLLVVALLTIPAFARLRPRRREDRVSRVPAALALVVGTALFLSGLSLEPRSLGLGLAIGGFVLFLPALRRLLPTGTLRLEPGLPALVAARGAFYSAFVGVEAFLALMLTSIHDFSSVVTGLVLASGAISWTVGSWLQDRFDNGAAGRNRSRRVLVGTIILSVGLALQLVALYAPRFPLLPALGGWLLAGLGIGLAHATSAVLSFAFAPEGEEGAVASSLQLADQFTAALTIGMGGALLALMTAVGSGERAGVLAAFLVSLVLALIGVAAASRIAGSTVGGGVAGRSEESAAAEVRYP